MNTDYKAVWQAIKQNGEATITVSKYHARTVTQAVVKTKCKENVIRKNACLVYWAKLEIDRMKINSDMIRITFRLKYDAKL